MSEIPKVDVIYRIQNVDSRLYLERSAIPIARMRLEDATSRRQHWKIIRLPGSPEGEYRIVDPYNSQSPALCYNPPPTANLVVSRPANSGPQHNFWNIVSNAANSGEKAFYLVTIDPNGGSGVVLGNNVPNDTKPIVGFLRTVAEPPPADGSPSVQTAAANFHWKIFEVSPAALPDDANSKYRIRAFLGKPLQVDAAGNLNLDLTDARGDQRVWTITDKGNGKCTVYSDKARLYLTPRNVSTSGGFDWQPTLRAATEPSFTEVERLWTFEKTTNLTHTIYVNRQAAANGPIREFALALDGSNATLKPKKLAHNEVWLVEPIDTPMPGGSTGIGVTPGAPVFGFPPGLASNETYRFRNREWPNTTTPNFIVHNYVGYNTYSFTSSTGGTPVGIRVETKAPGGVALYTLISNQRYYLTASGTSIASTPLTVADTATGWTVTQISPNNGGQYTIMLENRLLSATTSSLTLAEAQSPPAPWQIWTISP